MLAIALPAQSPRRLPVSVVVLVLPLALLGACRKEGGPPQRPTPTVSVQTATKGPLPYVVEANGQVEPNRTVAVQSLVSGQLTRIAIAEGDEVREGQVLFQIDARPFRAELERVKATLARDEANLTRARADSARFAALAQDGYVTKQQLDQTFAEVSSLSATVAAGRAQLERAEFDLENTTIRAPIGGRTGQLLYRAGSLVRATTDQLVTINELRPVLVRFPVPERDFEELRRRAGVDQKLRVRISPNGGDSTHAIDGTLTFVDNQVDRASGSVLLKATAPNQDRALWPGQFVNVALTLSVDSDAVTVPSQAVVTSGSNTFVYTMVDNVARRTPVKVGRQAGLVSKIDSGLVGGEQVIVEGQTRLTDGAKVRLRTPPGGPNGAPGDGPAGTVIKESANAVSPAAKPPVNPGTSPGGVKP
jgi:multidrug efflux system membrane fusion protein